MAEELFRNYFRYSEERLLDLGCPHDVATFLATTGLPEWCAPHAHFGPCGDQWTELPSRQIGTMSYVGLGEDQDDNLIALALKSGDVWSLSESAHPVYVAANVRELSDSLHAFQTCVDAAVAEDSQAAVEARIPHRHLQSFFSWARDLNPHLVGHRSFWAQELCRNRFSPKSVGVSGADGTGCP